MRGEEATTNEKVPRVIETLAGLIFVTFLRSFLLLVTLGRWRHWHGGQSLCDLPRQ